MMRVLAVTGGIGSGKSYVVQMFAALGIPVYDADSRTKQLYSEDGELLASLKGLLGEDLVRSGVLDRQYMASRIFSDSSLLSQVEAVVFPRVIRDFGLWLRTRGNEDETLPFAIMESAIFLEKPSLRPVADKVLTVTCPEEVRVKRVMVRSSMTREEVLSRMANQWPDSKRLVQSDYVIVSDFAHPLLPQVYSVYEKMKEEAKR